MSSTVQPAVRCSPGGLLGSPLTLLVLTSMVFCLVVFDVAQLWYVELHMSLQKLTTILFAVIVRLLLPSGEIGASLGEMLIPVV